MQITIDMNKRYKENILNMFDGRKLILSPFTGRKKRKAWNKTKEKYMPVKRSQIETDRGSYYNKEDG